jgi:hypothetical protein
MRCLPDAPRFTVSPPRAIAASAELSTFCEEIERDLGLQGVPSIAELGPRLLVHASQLAAEARVGVH